MPTTDLLNVPLNRRELIAVLGGALLAACSSGDSDGGMGPDDSDPDATVDMTSQFTFSPAEVTIPVGGTVLWRNVSGVVHTVTADENEANDPSNVQLPQGAQPFNSGSIAGGGEFERTFDVPGEYHYFCIPHESFDMLGRIIVTG